MADITNNDMRVVPQQLTIRVGQGTLAFALPPVQAPAAYEPYVVRSGVSMAANLREAFKTAALLQTPPKRARVMVDSAVLMVPIEIFDQDQMGVLYDHAFPREESDVVLYNVLPDVNAVAVFALNKDLRTVLEDHFSDVRYVAAVAPVWRHLHQRSYTGAHRKLYGYFHEKRLEVFSFQQNRFKFCNSFDARHAHDALYFLLYVWNQLQMQQEYDELHVVGQVPEPEWLMGELAKYLKKTFVINPVTDLAQPLVTDVKGMPYDLMTLFVKGR